MASPLKSVLAFLKSAFGGGKTQKKPAPTGMVGPVPKHLNQSQQQQLQALCEQLLRKQELITSGRLQMLGLQKVKRQMGKNWPGLQKIVYETVEEVIRSHIKRGDLYIRYGDDTYIMVFADADTTECELRAKLIAEDVRKRLFGMNQPVLKEISFEASVHKLRAKDVQGKSMDDVMGLMATRQTAVEPAPVAAQPAPDVRPIQVEAVAGGIGAAETPSLKEGNDYLFAPLWDVHNKALTTYLCLPKPIDSDLPPLAYYSALSRGKPYSARVTLDMRLLQAASESMNRMIAAGRKLFIVCPVHYDTLYRQESFDRFVAACQAMPESAREKFLFILITGLPDSLPAKDAFWFAAPLKKRICRAIFVQIPLEDAPDLSQFKGSGIDALGIYLPPSIVEATVMPQINGFKAKIAASGIQRSFMLNLPSLSLVTTSVCAGIDYLGGGAIHDVVPEPDSMYRYQHEDLLSALITTQS